MQAQEAELVVQYTEVVGLELAELGLQKMADGEAPFQNAADFGDEEESAKLGGTLKPKEEQENKDNPAGRPTASHRPLRKLRSPKLHAGALLFFLPQVNRSTRYSC